MKYLLFLLLFTIPIVTISQSKKDLFETSEYQFYWLGIDYSHVKFIGEFSEGFGLGDKTATIIRDKYYSEWNYLVINEPSKYDIKNMIRKYNIINDIKMINELNRSSVLDSSTIYYCPNYTKDSIADFIKGYNFSKPGIGIVFVTECLNKDALTGVYHFAVINLSTNEIILHDRIVSSPRGFGFRNYWAGSIYNTIKQIKSSFSSWSIAYKKEEKQKKKLEKKQNKGK